MCRLPTRPLGRHGTNNYTILVNCTSYNIIASRSLGNCRKVMEALKILRGDLPIREACRYTYCLRNPTRKGLILQPSPLEKPSQSCFVCNTNTVIRTYIHTFFSFYFSFISLIADGPHHYHPACGHKGSSHLSPVHALQFFYRDASSALLQLVNQWLNFTYSRSHAFRYERKNTNPTLVRIELTTSVLADVQLTY